MDRRGSSADSQMIPRIPLSRSPRKFYRQKSKFPFVPPPVRYTVGLFIAFKCRRSCGALCCSVSTSMSHHTPGCSSYCERIKTASRGASSPPGASEMFRLNHRARAQPGDQRPRFSDTRSLAGRPCLPGRRISSRNSASVPLGFRRSRASTKRADAPAPIVLGVMS